MVAPGTRPVGPLGVHRQIVLAGGAGHIPDAGAAVLAYAGDAVAGQEGDAVGAARVPC